MLLLHGTGPRRDAVARELHAAGMAAAGPYLRVDCRSDARQLQASVLEWIAAESRDATPGGAHGTPTVTVFLDSVETLSLESQRLLIVLLDRLADAFAAGKQHPIGRLIVGSSVGLDREVLAGRFLPELYDALDKVRVDLAALHDEAIRAPRRAR